VELFLPHLLSGIGRGTGGHNHGTGHLLRVVGRHLAMLNGHDNLLSELWRPCGAGVSVFFSSVALVQEFVEWRRHTEPSPLKRLLLPPAS
jgi:hypothetical protein